MSFYCRLFDLSFRLRDYLKETGVYSLYDQLKEEQFLPYERIAQLQSERLQHLLRRAQKHSPYYRHLFRKHNIEIDERFDMSRLRALPLLRRENLQESIDDILCEDAHHVRRNSSGGSTGNPVNFYQDDTYARWSEAQNLLFYSWLGVQPGEKTAVFWGADRDLKDLSLNDRLFNRIHRLKQLNSFSMTEENLSGFIDELNKYRPRYVYGYSSSLSLAAQFINKSKPLTFTPLSVRSSAEMLYVHQRNEIERAFGARVYNSYGSREVNNMAAECSVHDGLHIFASGRIVEVVDHNGIPVPDGTMGNIVVTDVTNMAFPFIRYLIGDVAVKRREPCSCGRGYPLLVKIEGRSSDMIVVNGQYIHGEFFTHLFYDRRGIKRFQLVQEDTNHLRLRVVSHDNRLDLDDILTSIHERVGKGVTIELEYTDTIPPTPSGKYRFTISKLPGRMKNDIA